MTVRCLVKHWGLIIIYNPATLIQNSNRSDQSWSLYGPDDKITSHTFLFITGILVLAFMQLDNPVFAYSIIKAAAHFINVKKLNIFQQEVNPTLIRYNRLKYI